MQLPKLTKSNKKERKQYSDDGLFESLESILTGTADEFKRNTKDGTHQAVDQVLVREAKNSTSGELSQGEEFDLESLKHAAHEVTEMGHEFAQEIIHAGKRADVEDQRESQIKVQEILIELKQLAKSTKEVQTEAQIISEETTVTVAGAYKLNFLESMLSWIRDARENVEDSLAWFQALRAKKSSRQYGAMAKKHGTSFTLSNERTAATQTG